MGLFKKLFERKKQQKAMKSKGNESWFNDSKDKKPTWQPPVEGEYYDGVHHDMAVTNSIAKRQH